MRLWFTLLALAAAPLRADVPFKDGEKVAFLGDSITAQGWSNAHGYVKLVVAALAANDVRLEPLPAGVGGNTSADMLARLKRDVLDRHPVWVTVSCGMNDVIHGAKGVPLEQYKVNMTAIVDQCQAAGIKVILFTTTTAWKEANGQLGAESEFVRGLAQQKHCLLADLFTAFSDAGKTATPLRALTGDGVHLTPEGNLLLATTVLKALGCTDTQLAKARETWLDLPGAGTFNTRVDVELNKKFFTTTTTLTLRQREKLLAAAEAARRPTLMHWSRDLLLSLVKRRVKPAGPYESLDALFAPDVKDKVQADLATEFAAEIEKLMKAPTPTPPAVTLTPAQIHEPYAIPVEIAPGPFTADWRSFTADKLKPEPDWWRHAKIGVWFHWGPQSMGRNGDWYARFLYQQQGGRAGRANNITMYNAHLQRYGHPSQVGYMDVLHEWRAPAFDPDRLMDLYASCGARYILVQGSHHDNFDLWNSKFQPWNSVNVGPKRDIVGEMYRAARARQFRVGLAFHADYSLWWYQPAFGADTTGPHAGVPYDAASRTKESGKGLWWEELDPRDLYGIDLKSEELPGKDVRTGFFTPINQLFTHADTREFAKRYCLKWFNRLKQVVDDYDPDFVYTDGNEPFTGRGTAMGVVSDAAVKLVAHMYNQRLARHGAVDCMAVIKGGPHIPGVASPREGGYDGPIMRSPWVWEHTCGEWFFEEHTYYHARPMVMQMIEAICRDGNFMFNISLTPEGALEPGAEQMWRDFGAFVKTNAEAIYGSRAWQVLGEGRTQTDPRNPKAPPHLVGFPRSGLTPEIAAFPMTTQDVRFTQGPDGAVYAFVLTVPQPGETVTLRSLANEPVKEVSLLGVNARLEWRRTPGGLVITCPADLPLRYAAVFKVVS